MLDQADEQRVIAGGVDRDDPADKARERTFQQW
jgi:hypothetical protein